MANDNLISAMKGGPGSGRKPNGSSKEVKPPKGVSKEDYAQRTKEANDRYQSMLNIPVEPSKPGEIESWNHGGELYNKVKETNSALASSKYPQGHSGRIEQVNNAGIASDNLAKWQKEHQAKFGRLQKPPEVASQEENL